MDRIRIDKWLWAARFYKTRTLATQAVDAGHIRLNDERPKPSKEVRVGDRVAIRIGEYEWDLTVTGLADRRGSAAVARTLYVEDEASLVRRQEQMAMRRLSQEPSERIRGRPTKRDRRQIHRFTRE